MKSPSICDHRKSFFDFAGNAPANEQRLYAHEAGMNVANRWNGHDAVSIGRGVIVPSPPARRVRPALPSRRSGMVCPEHAVRGGSFRSHHARPGRPRQSLGSRRGRGESTITGYDPEPSQWFPLAHESGHMNGLPDEYNERWNACSYGQLSFKANLPGDPYEPDGRDEAATYPDTGMMNGNRRIRNRYFWHAAEWIREITGTSMAVNYRDASGDEYDGYWLPPHPQAANQLTYDCHPVAGLRDQPPGAPWTQCDVWLYALGKDQYTANPAIVPHASPPAPYDGILVIALRLACTLSGSPPLNEEIDWRENALSVFAAVIRNDLNFRFAASGTGWFAAGRVSKMPDSFCAAIPGGELSETLLRPGLPWWSAAAPYDDVDNTALAAEIRGDFGTSFARAPEYGEPSGHILQSASLPSGPRFPDVERSGQLSRRHVPRVPGHVCEHSRGIPPPAVQTLLGEIFLLPAAGRSGTCHDFPIGQTGVVWTVLRSGFVLRPAFRGGASSETKTAAARR